MFLIELQEMRCRKCSSNKIEYLPEKKRDLKDYQCQNCKNMFTPLSFFEWVIMFFVGIGVVAVYVFVLTPYESEILNNHMLLPVLY